MNESVRVPKPYGEIKEYIDTHGFGDDDNLIAWLDRLKHDSQMTGSEEISISFLSELIAAFNFAAILNIPNLVTSSVSFSSKKSQIREFQRTVKVVWNK